MYANAYCVHNVHNFTIAVEGGGGGLYTGLVVLFSSFSAILKSVQVIIGLMLQNRILSSVKMDAILFTKYIYLVKYNKSCLKRLKLSDLIGNLIIGIDKSRQSFSLD